MNLVLLPLAHAGEGATWQALLTLLALGLAIVFVLAAARVLTIEEPGDLILPLAGTAVLASLSGATSSVLSDWVGWAFPLGVVALLALVLAASTPLPLSLTSPLAIVSVVAAVVGALVFQDSLSRAWHPEAPPINSVTVDDLTIEIVDPADGATIERGTLEIVVRATGGTIGDGSGNVTDVSDPEKQISMNVWASSDTSGELIDVTEGPLEDCTSGCTDVTYVVELSESGSWNIYVEGRPASDAVFTPTDQVQDVVEVQVS